MNRHTVKVINEGLRNQVSRKVVETEYYDTQKTMNKLALVLKILS